MKPTCDNRACLVPVKHSSIHTNEMEEVEHVRDNLLHLAENELPFRKHEYIDNYTRQPD